MKKTRNFAALIGVFVLFLFIFQMDTRESAAADIVSVQPHFAEGPDGIGMAVEMAFPQGYHAYAHESGDAGRPTTLSIRLDDGSGLPVWYPQGFMQRDLFDPDATVYVYESPTTLFVLLPHEARHRGFEAVLSMLLCSSRNCLPVSQTISGQVPDTLPGLEEAPWKARWEELRRLPPVLSKGSAPVSGLPFAMDEGGAGGLSAVTDPAQDPLAALQEEDGEKPLPPPDGFALELTPQYADGSVEISGFGMALAVGILAGLLLNAMPCVLPVLTFKISGLLLMGGRGDKESLRRFREHNLFFSAGIMTLFTLLALVLGAADMIWGQLYQQQSLLLGLVMLVFLMGLSMLGVFTLPVIDLKAGANSKNPRLQPYLTGLVSTFLATPCSGPLLGGVLGWAFTQPLLVLMVVFWAVGLGMALPYILFSIWPQLARILPRPGNWMKVFERVLGFCLLGTALYLLSILPVEKHMQVLCVLLVLSLVAWLWGQFCGPASPRLRCRIIGALTVLILVGSFIWVLRPAAPLVQWREFSPEQFQADLGQKAMLLEFTADSCPNCKVLEATVLTDERMRKLRARYGMELIRVDLTGVNAYGIRLLEALGSKSIPLTALFPAGEQASSPLVLRDVYTAGTLEDALEKAFGQ